MGVYPGTLFKRVSWAGPVGLSTDDFSFAYFDLMVDHFVHEFVSKILIIQ